MASHSNILAWRIPWTEEPEGLQSMRSKQLDMTKQLTHTHIGLFIYLFIYSFCVFHVLNIHVQSSSPKQIFVGPSSLWRRRHWQPTPVLLPGKSHGWRSLSEFTFTFMHWRRKRQPTPVFLPGKSQGWGSLMGCRLWGLTKFDMTDAT